MAERNASLGYLALGKETTKGVAVTPAVFVPYYEQSLETDENIIQQTPVFGNKFRTFAALQGHREHKGSLTILGEPNTIGYFLDMLFTKLSSQVIYTFTVTSANATVGATYTNNGATFTVLGTIAAGTTLICSGTGAPLASGTLTKATGTGDATITFSANTAGATQHSFGLSPTTDPNAYTLDIGLGSQVIRYMGVQASKIEFAYDNDEMKPKVSVSALGSFYGAEIASIATTVLTLATTHDPIPTYGLVVGDTVAVKKIDGSLTTNFTISALTNTTVTLNATAAAFAAGDMIVLRQATPSYTLLPAFVWPLQQFCFGATAAAALVAAQTRLEPGSMVTLNHDFRNDGGENRSGAYDPASLIRMVGDADFKIKQYFDNPDQIKQWLSVAKNACQARAFSQGTTYELRATLNNLRIVKNPLQTKFDETVIQEEEYVTVYDSADAQGIGMILINAITVY